jgi:phosphoserine phosphatase
MSIAAFPQIQQFLKTHSNHASRKPGVAVFDCDGTVIKGDIGEAMLYYQLEHFHFKVSPADVWPDHPRRSELDRWYNILTAVDAARRSAQPEFVPFADTILSWYFDQLAEGRIEKACADIVRLFAGHTLDEVRRIAESTFLEEAWAPVSERTLGTRPRPKGARYIKESTELVTLLMQRGFDIWAVSGSNKWSVEPVFRRLGIPAEQVIGIDLIEHDGILSSTPQEPVPIQKKKVDALRERIPEAPLLVASDSRLDIPLLQYSSGLRIYVNSHQRNPSDFFIIGKVVRDDSWVVIERPTLEPEGYAR